MSHQFKLISDKELYFTEKELFAFLLEKIHATSQEKDELKRSEEYTKNIFELLNNEIIANANFNQLFTLFFLSGFYYANFLSKNEVQIIEKNEEE